MRAGSSERDLIVQAHEWGKYVGRADFEFRNGEMKLVHYQLIPVNLKKKVTYPDGKSERVLYTPEIAENQQMLSADAVPEQRESAAGREDWHA